MLFRSEQSGIWQVDESNTVDDAKAFYNNLAIRNNIPKSTKYSLELALGFEFSTPNNALSMLWASSGQWTALLKR